MINNKLINFGLTEKESGVYLSLLKLEIAPVNEVAKASGINRSSTYVVLESLKKKGLVGISDDKNVRRYVATSPESLLQIAKEKAEEQWRVLEDIKSIVPELKKLSKNTRQKPRIRLYEGGKSIREIYTQSFGSRSKKLRIYANSSLELLKNRKSNKGEVVLIPSDSFNTNSELMIYNNNIAIVSTLEKLGIIIESKEVAKMFKVNFDLAWEEAKRLDKEIRKKHKIK